MTAENDTITALSTNHVNSLQRSPPPLTQHCQASTISETYLGTFNSS